MAIADSLRVYPLVWYRQVEAGLSLISVATCVSTFLKEACEVRGPQCTSSQGPQNNRKTQQVDPRQVLTPTFAVTLPPEPAQLGPSDSPGKNHTQAAG